MHKAFRRDDKQQPDTIVLFSSRLNSNSSWKMENTRTESDGIGRRNRTLFLLVDQKCLLIDEGLRGKAEFEENELWRERI